MPDDPQPQPQPTEPDPINVAGWELLGALGEAVSGAGAIVGSSGSFEGAAGAGKTARLAATRERAIAAGRRLVVVTPTLKAAQVAEGAIGFHPVGGFLHHVGGLPQRAGDGFGQHGVVFDN